MQSVAIELERPIDQFVDHQNRKHNIPPQQTISELVAMGFEALLRERYQRYRQGEISFGRLAQDMGVTTWELSHLLEDRDWVVHNLPSAG
jgi:hypothetical protein